MDSVPPASTTRDSPSRICCAPWAIASKPEPQSRFTVTAGVSIGQAGLEPDVAGEVGGVGGGLEDVAEDDVVHVGRAATPDRASASGAGERTQVRGGKVFEGAAEGAEAGADAGEEDDGGLATWDYGPPEERQGHPTESCPRPLQGIASDLACRSGSPRPWE